MSLFLPRETVEFIPVPVEVDGVTVTTNLTFTVIPAADRPISGWTAPTILNGVTGVLVSGLTPGVYTVWAKIIASPETPVLECGRFTVT